MTNRVDSPISEPISDSISDLNGILGSYIELIGMLLAALVGAPNFPKTRTKVEDDVAAVVGMLCQGAGSSCQSIRRNHSPGYETRDCFILARSVIESLINCCYVLAEGPATARKAIRHARQKSYRDLKRNSEIASSRISMSIDTTPSVEEIAGLAEDLAEFSQRSGQEDRQWTKLSVDDRIRIAGEKFGDSVLTKLHVARFAVYRHSSEIIHGSFFGAAFWGGFIGTSGPPKSEEEFLNNVGNWHWLILFGVILANHAFLSSFHKSYGLDAVNDRSIELLRQLEENPYYIDIKSGLHERAVES